MELSLELGQRQMLSPKQQQSLEILQMPCLALAEYAKEMAEENPFLEWQAEAPDSPDARLLQKLEWLEESDEQNRGLYRVEREAETLPEPADAPGQTLREYLLLQINMLHGTVEEERALRFLAENTAESGYLEADVISALMQAFHLKESRAASLLCQFQGLEPVGVGARDLRECLLLQLKAKGASALAQAVVSDFLEELAKNRLPYLAKKLGVSIAEMQAAAAEIRACEPKPGRGFAGGAVEYVVPDVLVEREGAALAVHLRQEAVPRLQISHAYAGLLRRDADAQTAAYIAKKLKQAEWLLQCIAKRESTLRQVAESIVRRQAPFFADAAGRLLPLRMADIAAELELHPSTVSRAVKEKYLQCERGIFPMQFFFSQELAAAGESISADSTCEALRALIAAEDKRHPLSDRSLAERLEAQGICISRRTVAKYRESMGIAPAAGRKIF